jgi:uncharacterized protein
MLGQIDAALFKRCLGVFLAVYAAAMLTIDARSSARWATAWGGKAADAAIGFAGGILGGLAGLSGSIMVVWAALRGWDKDEKRGIFQAFNFSMLLVSGISHACHGLHTRAVGMAVLVAVPLSLVAANIGHRIYLRLSAQRFDRAVLWLLLCAGVGLLLAPR